MIERRGAEMSQRLAEKGAQASRGMAEMVRRAGERGSEMTASMMETVDRDVDMVKSNISTHPLASLAIAAGMGFLMGAAIGAASSYMMRGPMYESRYE
jgi:ElaB/YqjD/DUF883 family membrane-anchored ribosome-binding protein